MNKSEIRKKILKIRKKNISKNLYVNFQDILNILKKNKITGRLVGGYYPYNYEYNVLNILEKFEKKNIKFYCRKLKKIFK